MKLFGILTAVLIAGMASAFEVTLTNTATLIAPKAGIVTAQNWNTNETITAGDYRKINSDIVVAQIGGTTSNGVLSTVTTNDNLTTVVVSGSISPDVTGNYVFDSARNAYTNTGKGWMIYQSAGEYKLVTNSLYRIGTTNKFYTSALIGTYTNGGNGVTGNPTTAYAKTVTTTYSIIKPTLINGATVDNTVRWLKVPATRKALVLDTVSGDTVYTDASGNKIYTDDITLTGYTEALYGASTNGAVVEVFQY